jgi:hypothetical protein
MQLFLACIFVLVKVKSPAIIIALKKQANEKSYIPEIQILNGRVGAKYG